MSRAQPSRAGREGRANRRTSFARNHDSGAASRPCEDRPAPLLLLRESGRRRRSSDHSKGIARDGLGVEG